MFSTGTASIVLLQASQPIHHQQVTHVLTARYFQEMAPKMGENSGVHWFYLSILVIV